MGLVHKIIWLLESYLRSLYQHQHTFGDMLFRDHVIVLFITCSDRTSFLASSSIRLTYGSMNHNIDLSLLCDLLNCPRFSHDQSEYTPPPTKPRKVSIFIRSLFPHRSWGLGTRLLHQHFNCQLAEAWLRVN